MNTVAFVIGNGESRKFVSLEKLKNHGLIIGCNALYRDFEPDYLVTVDDSMRKEVINSGYKGKMVYVDINQRDKKRYVFDNAQLVFEDRIWSSGGLALDYVSRKPDINLVYLIGFDFDPKVNDKLKSINNMYKGTSNYSKEDAPAKRVDSFLAQATTIFGEHPQTRYVWVNNKPRNLWEDKKNVSVLDLEIFYRQFKCKEDLVIVIDE